MLYHEVIFILHHVKVGGCGLAVLTKHYLAYNPPKSIKPHISMIQIPNYTIQKVIGRGGMALVYLAVQDMLSREVALKVLLPDMVKDDNLRKSFLNEGKIVASLDHPNIVSIYDIGVVEDSIFYMTMEYISGGTLKEKLLTNQFSYKEALKILEDIAEGLSYAHDKSYIHRDIKPGNILFRDDGSAVLTDFGIAKLQDSSGDLTRLGLTVGTAQYMSPEQAKSSKIDSRADIYSLGLVFFEILSGKKAFQFENTFQAIQQHTMAAPPKLPEEYSHLQPIINKVLAKKPKDRYQTTLEFVQAVKNAGYSSITSTTTGATIHTDTTIIHTAQQPFNSRLKRKPFLLFSAVAGFILVGATAIAFFNYFSKVATQDVSTKPIKKIVQSPTSKTKAVVASPQEPTSLPITKNNIKDDFLESDNKNNKRGDTFINEIKVADRSNSKGKENNPTINTNNSKPKTAEHFEKGCDNLAALVKESLSRTSNDDIFGMSAHNAGAGSLCAQKDLNYQLKIYKAALEKGNYDTLNEYIYPPISEGKSLQSMGEILILPYLSSDKVSTHTQLISLPFKKYSKGIYVNIFSNIVMTMDMGTEFTPAELQKMIRDNFLSEAQKSIMKSLAEENGAFNITFKKNTLEATFYIRKRSFAIYEINKGWSIMYYDYKTLNKIRSSLPKGVADLLTNSLASDSQSRRN